MSPQPNPTPLTPEHLLAMVRRASQRFQRREIAVPMEGAPLTEATEPGFAPRSPVVSLPEVAPDADIAERPEDIPHEPPSARDQPKAGFQAAPPPETIDLDAERARAFAAGRAEALAEIEAARTEARNSAIAEMRAEIEAEVAETRDALGQALGRFLSAEHAHLEGLTESLEQAIRTLASKRAGQKIEEAPQPFLRKIEKMTREVASAVEAAVVSMNPADLVAIQPHLKGFSPLSKARLIPDPKLGRGDIRIRMDNITFSDVMAERNSGSLA